MSERKTKLEVFKEEGRQLRGRIAGDLSNAKVQVTDASKQLLKFHGLYEQDDRDLRRERRRESLDKAYSFMVRSKIPGGRLSADQYLVHDDLATRYGNDTLRITTRQDFQLHGVLKGDVKGAVKGLNNALVTTLGACGDVVRNVMCCPLPSNDPVRLEVEALARGISDRTLPRTRAYHEIWLDGDKVYSGKQEPAGEEPLYGKAYLPRKFKISVAYPGDNCTDVYTQDLGLVAIVKHGRLSGFNLLVGGGLGMTHKKPETFPRLADPLAFVRPEQVLDVVEQIVCVHRDHGDRTDRRHARLKYLIHDQGLDWFRKQVQRRLDHGLQQPVTMPSFDIKLHLGWQRQNGDRWCLGLSVENGRVKDHNGLRLKSGLRSVVERYRTGVRLTPSQDVLLTDIPSNLRAEVETVLRDHGIVDASRLSNARRYSMACPALPTCGLALAEAERFLPTVIDDLEVELHRAGLGNEKMTIRMTGCPNGCARPYVADLGFVGRSLGKYVVLVGGRSDGSRLNQVYADLVEADELVDTVRPLFSYFREARRPGESFGDFCHRVGLKALREYARTHGKIAAHG